MFAILADYGVCVWRVFQVKVVECVQVLDHRVALLGGDGPSQKQDLV